MDLPTETEAQALISRLEAQSRARTRRAVTQIVVLLACAAVLALLVA